VSGVVPVVSGVGIHSGATATVRLHRDEGALRFRSAGVIVPARVAQVIATPRCTVLGAEGVSVATVEHLLAALVAAGFWSGVLIEVDGPELPILDGSAAPWGEAVDALGAAPEAPPPLALHAPLLHHEGPAVIVARPGHAALEVHIDFAHRSIGVQTWRGTPTSYRELLAARTFALEADLHQAQARGFARGAAPGRGIVFGAQGPDTPLRAPDEPVRHKALDAIGDLALLGRPLAAHVRIERGSHAAHVSFMRRLDTHSHDTADEPAAPGAS
jgi:UDP-3-O-[3-hydroxymyristoyl] N-acetylglucosamine deacetylase